MFDHYTRTARLAPALIAASPPIVLIAAAASSPWTPARIGGALAGCLGLVVVAFVRDRGRHIQTELWSGWGGSPTTRRLRFREGNHDQVARLHARVTAATGVNLPDRATEDVDSADADARYDEAVAALRELTRDQIRFPIVFNENVNYGWRRNSLGLRALALCIAGATALASGALLIFGHGALNTRAIDWGPVLAASILALGWWSIIVNQAWVRLAAELYADRLLDSAFLLTGSSP